MRILYFIGIVILTGVLAFGLSAQPVLSVRLYVLDDGREYTQSENILSEWEKISGAGAWHIENSAETGTRPFEAPLLLWSGVPCGMTATTLLLSAQLFNHSPPRYFC